MTVSNIFIVYVTLFVFTTVQGNSIPIEIAENQWIADAQNSIKDSLSKIESYGVEIEKIKTITNEAFDAFTNFTGNELSNVIKQMDNIKSENVWILKTQLTNWLNGLEKLNKVSDVNEKTPDQAIAKFYFIIDYISKKVVGFDQNLNYDSIEFKKIVEELKLLLKKTVAKLVEYASSVEDQVSGISKIE